MGHVTRFEWRVIARIIALLWTLRRALTVRLAVLCVYGGVILLNRPLLELHTLIFRLNGPNAVLSGIPSLNVHLAGVLVDLTMTLTIRELLPRGTGIANDLPLPLQVVFVLLVTSLVDRLKGNSAVTRGLDELA